MIKFSLDQIKNNEKNYEGIASQIMKFDNRVLPPCPFCGSEDTAVVLRAAIGRTIAIAAATTKVTLSLKPDSRHFYCHACKQQFDLLF